MQPTADTPPAPTEPQARPAPTAAPAKQPGVWGGLGTVALYFLLQVGLGALIGGILGFVLALKAGVAAARHHAKPDINAIVALMKGNAELRVILTVATLVSAAALMAVLVRRFWPTQWSRAELPGFGFARPTRKRYWVIALACGLALPFAGDLLTRLLAGGHPINQDVSVMAAQVPLAMRALLALVVVCVAPLIEELVFRGVLLSGLARRMPVGLAILASALVFGAVHLPDFSFAWYPVPALALLGLAAGWLRVSSRSLWPAIALHATNNLLAVLAWFLVSHPH